MHSRSECPIMRPSSRRSDAILMVIRLNFIVAIPRDPEVVVVSVCGARLRGLAIKSNFMRTASRSVQQDDYSAITATH